LQDEIPDFYIFEYDEISEEGYINDGGLDMYDSGNYLGTDIYNPEDPDNCGSAFPIIPYTVQGTINGTA